MLVPDDRQDDMSPGVLLKAVVIGAASGAGILRGHSRFQVGPAAVQQAVQVPSVTSLPVAVACRAHRKLIISCLDPLASSQHRCVLVTLLGCSCQV